MQVDDKWYYVSIDGYIMYFTYGRTITSSSPGINESRRKLLVD